ncbi:MAG: exonuclease SbcCD subunit D [Actinomycetaceae bacterium]|nr:exonuclease SbcCD subunit D [Actinomycetaceae bacterium]
MRFLHTADWHLGRTLHGADLTEAFQAWADHVVALAATRDVDAVLISGDVYDRAIPPVTMVELLSDTLTRLAEHTHVIMTPGNHDAPKRLGFASGLMSERLTIISDVLDSGTPVKVRRDGEVVGLVYAIPYLDPDMERGRLSDTDEPLARSHQAVMEAALGLVGADIARGEYQDVPRVVMAHAFVLGGEKSDSERDIHIGGVDSVPASVFRVGEGERGQIDYVALGHLHGPQIVNADSGPLIRYSGSPIAFSFSEEKHRKSSVLVEISHAGADPSYELIPAPLVRPLVTVRGTLAELISEEYSQYQDYYVRARVTDPERPANMYLRLRSAFPHLLEHQHETEQVQLRAAELRALTVNPVETITEFFNKVGGRDIDSKEREIITDAWDELMKEAR